MRGPLFAGLLLSLIPGTVLAGWTVAAGPTRTEGAAIELALTRPRWDIALGYVSVQHVNVKSIQDTCYAQPAGMPVCVTKSEINEKDTAEYGYLSVQRRFSIQRDWRVLPVFGLGLVGQTGTNPYVSSPVSFSLSAGLRFSDHTTLEWRHFSNAGLEQPNLGQDILLLRWTF